VAAQQQLHEVKKKKKGFTTRVYHLFGIDAPTGGGGFNLTSIKVQPQSVRANLKTFAETVADDFVKVMKAQADRVVESILKKFVESVSKEFKKMDDTLVKRRIETERQKKELQAPRTALVKEIDLLITTTKTQSFQL